MRNPAAWWIFQPRGRQRRRLTPIGLAWTLAAYLALGIGTYQAVGRLAALDAPSGPVLLVLLASLGWVGVRVCIDGEWVRASSWFTGIGWGVVIHLMTETPVCGTLVFGAGLPGVSPGQSACLPHQDFMATTFIAAWVLLGPASTVLLSALGLYRWLRRDPLHAYRLLID